MSKIEVVTQGYAEFKGQNFIASPTTVLVRTHRGKLAIIDPGSNTPALLEGLDHLKITPGSIDLICLTHTHVDHLLNIRIFPHAPVYEWYYLYHRDSGIYSPNLLDSFDMTVIATPGHCDQHVSYLVQTENDKVAVAGDVFWWLKGEKQETQREQLLTRKDGPGTNPNHLYQSRKRLLESADIIIPGHGKPFRTSEIK